MAVPYMRDSHLDYQQEAAPRRKEAQGRALRHNRAFRDALVALAPAVVAEDFGQSPLEPSCIMVDTLSGLFLAQHSSRTAIMMLLTTLKNIYIVSYKKDNYLMLALNS